MPNKFDPENLQLMGVDDANVSVRTKSFEYKTYDLINFGNSIVCMLVIHAEAQVDHFKIWIRHMLSARMDDMLLD